MKAYITLALAISATSCSSSESGEAGTLGGLTYLAPAGWSSKDLSTRERPMFEWTPSDNAHKESVDVFRVARAAAAKSPTDRIERFLVEAQQKLLQGRFSAPSHFTTRHGLKGVRIEGEFLPPNQTNKYQRLHAVLVDGTSLVHVIYTAREADRENFELVVSSFGRGA